MWKTQPPKIAGKLRGSIFSLSRALNFSSQNLPLRKRFFTGNSRWVTMIICLEGEGSVTLTCSTEQYYSRSDVHSVNFAWLNMINISRWSLDTQMEQWLCFLTRLLILSLPVVCRMLVTSSSLLTCVDEPTFVFRFNVITKMNSYWLCKQILYYCIILY